MIFKIAKKELQLLFYSPIAWILWLSFTIQMSVKFVARFQSAVNAVGGFYGISEFVYTALNYGTGGIWEYAHDHLFLYIPLLTMGIVSREVGNGSIKLMYSSPVTNYQIIMGKFVSLMGYALLMLLPLFLFVIFGWLTCTNFEILWVLTGLLGLFLLICAYIAIGLFMSSLTTYQAVAAVGSFIILFLMSMIGKMGQQYEFVREITYWLSMKGRAVDFINGIICSENSIYFVSICAAFIALTVIRLDSTRQKRPFGITFLKNGFVLILLCIVAVFSSKPHLTVYWDTTSSKKNTLSEISKEIVTKIEGETIIYTYVNIFENGYPSFKYPDFIMRNHRAFKNYTRFKPSIRVASVIYYYAKDCANPNYPFLKKFPNLSERELANKFCEMEGFDPTILKSKAEIDEMTNLAGEGYTSVREIVGKNGKRAFYRNSGEVDIRFDEVQITTAFRRLMEEVPTIGFIKGHGERGLTDTDMQGYYSMLGDRTFRQALQNNGFDINEITLDCDSIANYTFLMLVDPRDTIPLEHEVALSNYIADGGSLFILGEPRRREVLNPFLSKYLGLELTPLIVQPFLGNAGDVPPNVIFAQIQPEYKTTGMNRLSTSGSRASRVQMKNASGLEVLEDKGFAIIPLAKTDSRIPAWTELESTDFVNEPVQFNPSVGEVSKVFTTILALTREVNGKDQKIIVASDADMLSNEINYVRYTVGSSNSSFMYDVGYWMSDYQLPLEIERKFVSDEKIKVDVDDFDVLRWIFWVLIPLIIASLAIFIWIRRRGR